MSNYYNGLGFAEMSEPGGVAIAHQPELPSTAYVKAYAMDPGTWALAAGGAGVAYLVSRDVKAAGGGALIGASLSLISHNPTARQMSTPFVLVSVLAGALGIFLTSSSR